MFRSSILKISNFPDHENSIFLFPSKGTVRPGKIYYNFSSNSKTIPITIVATLSSNGMYSFCNLVLETNNEECWQFNTKGLNTRTNYNVLIPLELFALTFDISSFYQLTELNSQLKMSKVEASGCKYIKTWRIISSSHFRILRFLSW